MRLAPLVCVLLISALIQPAEPTTRTIRRHFSPADRESGRYQYVPFDVAPATESLTIAYRYDGQDGASVVDLGLFEPGPLTLGTASFRGYSGGAQRTITVGRDVASPGYRAGALPAGTWHVLLGLYKVAPDGVDVDIDIALSQSARLRSPAASASFGGASPRSAADSAKFGGASPRSAADSAKFGATSSGRWYSGALHLHTTHSDGAVGPDVVSELARAAGLDFIAITDHNNTFHPRDPIPSFPLHIVGEEVTTPAGHASVWGLRANSFIDFRVSPNDRGAAERINAFAGEAHAVGALFSINHPYAECGGCSWQQVVPDTLDAIEIWNGETGPQDRAIELWDRLLQSGRRVTAIGASDWHRPPSRIDAAAVRVLARELSEGEILEGIRGGRVVVVRNAETTAPTVVARCGDRSAGIGDTLTCARGERIGVAVGGTGAANERADLIVNGSQQDSKPIANEAVFWTPAVAGYLRINTYSRAVGVIAIANPIYVATR